jgi:hypothetical protein
MKSSKKDQPLKDNHKAIGDRKTVLSLFDRIGNRAVAANFLFNPFVIPSFAFSNFVSGHKTTYGESFLQPYGECMEMLITGEIPRSMRSAEKQSAKQAVKLTK